MERLAVARKTRRKMTGRGTIDEMVVQLLLGSINVDVTFQVELAGGRRIWTLRSGEGGGRGGLEIRRTT